MFLLLNFGIFPLHDYGLTYSLREQVLENVLAFKNLPPEIAKSKIDNTNLFLRGMGLDAGMLQ